MRKYTFFRNLYLPPFWIFLLTILFICHSVSDDFSDKHNTNLSRRKSLKNVINISSSDVFNGCFYWRQKEPAREETVTASSPFALKQKASKTIRTTDIWFSMVFHLVNSDYRTTGTVAFQFKTFQRRQSKRREWSLHLIPIGHLGLFLRVEWVGIVTDQFTMELFETLVLIILSWERYLTNHLCRIGPGHSLEFIVSALGKMKVMQVGDVGEPEKRRKKWNVTMADNRNLNFDKFFPWKWV